MNAIPEGLTPANQNPFYVLMTLYGEQEGEEVDEELHAKNREAWNVYQAPPSDFQNDEIRRVVRHIPHPGD